MSAQFVVYKQPELSSAIPSQHVTTQQLLALHDLRTFLPRSRRVRDALRYGHGLRFALAILVARPVERHSISESHTVSHSPEGPADPSVAKHQGDALVGEQHAPAVFLDARKLAKEADH